MKTTSRFRHVNGKVSTEQIQRVSDWLSQSQPHKRKMVVCHHPFEIVLDKDQENVIMNSQEALLEWANAGLNFVLGGHIHYPFTDTLNPSENGSSVHVMQAGTACSSRVRNGQTNSFNFLEIGLDDPNIDVCSRYDYAAKDNDFIMTMRTNLPHSFL